MAHVVAASAHTPLGFSPAQSVLVGRTAGFEPRSCELRDRRGDRIGMCRVGGLGATSHGYERMVELAGGALSDLGLTEPMPLVLGVPEAGRADDDPRFATSIPHDVAARAGCTLDRERVAVVRAERTAGAVAVAQALAWIAEGVERVVVGAVDSHYHPGVVADLEDACRLHTLHAEEGFVPAEAAAFAVLSADASAGSVRVAQVATDLDPSARLEPAEDVPPDIAATMTALVQAAGVASWVLTDNNGERHRERWWRLLRAREGIAFDVVVEHLPQTLGDLGAATGLVALAHVYASFDLGLAPVERAWVLLHGEDGERGLMVVEGAS